ncbi:MAG TPA: PAS domain S-box protein [Thermoanaerobaculia bacterium]|nr:PAS domain S-box protein [Thermoanaerobaculia bacterium]
MFAALCESSTDWIWIVDAEGRHLYSNRAAERVIGYTNDEILALPSFMMLMHPDDRERADALLERATQTRGGWHGEVFRWKSKREGWRWLESSGGPFFDGHGAIAGFFGVDRDITEREDSERRFRDTFENASVGIAHVDFEGRWLRVNQQFAQMLGYRAEELLHRHFRELTHPDDLPMDTKRRAELIDGDVTSYSIDKRYLRQDGSAVWANLSASLGRNAAGEPEYVIAVVRDITLQKEHEAAIEESERDYRTLFECSNDALLVVDARTATITDANPRALEMYGYTSRELIGMSMADLSLDYEAGKQQALALLAGAPGVPFATLHRRADGTELELENTMALTNFRGRPAVLNANRDMTERNRLRRELEISEHRFRSIVQNGFDLVAIVDESRTATFVSGSVEQILGFTSEELLGIDALSLFHPDDQPRVEKALRVLAASTDRRSELVCRVRNKAGAWRWCEGTGVNMLQVEGVNGIVIIARDVTARLELESRLEQARRVDSLGRVAATVAHEFNNALMTIQPAVDILARRYGSDEKIARLAEQLSSGVKRGKRISQQILRFANPAEPARKRLDVCEWLHDVVGELRTVVGKNALVTIACDDELVIDADADQLHQLVTNLVVNARDAMTSGGTIAVGARRDDDAVEISVRDEGSGIPADVLPHLFEPLFTTKRNGTGIGLPVCQQIAAMHGGSITVESEMGIGTLVRTRIPSAPVSAARSFVP